MKKIIIIEILFVLLLSFIIFSLRSPDSMIYIEEGHIDMMVTPNVSSIPSEILSINEKNAKIRTFTSKIDLVIIDKIQYNLRGEVAFEKPRNFRMITKNRFGTLESDIGSNDNDFWFWSRRMKPPGLYYAAHSNLMNTGLKTPFNPMWMMESLGLSEIDTEEANFNRSGNRLTVKQLRLSTLREPIIKMTLIDCNNLRIIGQYIYKDGIVVASSEITKFSFNLPVEIKMSWHEENVQMIWKFKNPRIDNNIDSWIWTMPTKSPMIEMGS